MPDSRTDTPPLLATTAEEHACDLPSQGDHDGQEWQCPECGLFFFYDDGSPRGMFPTLHVGWYLSQWQNPKVAGMLKGTFS